jgi:hypothetical protein
VGIAGPADVGHRVGSELRRVEVASHVKTQENGTAPAAFFRLQHKLGRDF